MGSSIWPEVAGGGGGISLLTSSGATVTITNPSGPTANLEVSAIAGGITTLTGDVTAGPGAGSQVATIGANKVTFAKMQTVADQTILGNNTGGTAVPLALTAAQGRTVLGLGTLATQSGTFSGTTSGTNTGDQTITLTGDVTGTGTGSFAATIGAGKVTLAMHATQADQTIIGNGSGGTASPAALVVSTAGGLVAAAGTLKWTFTAGVAGGQTIIAGTGSGDSLTVSSTSNATKGKVIFGSTSGMYWDENLGTLAIGLGGTAPLANSTLDISKSINGVHQVWFANPSAGAAASTAFQCGVSSNGATGAAVGFSMYGTAYTTSGLLGANVGEFNINGGTSNLLIGVFQNTGAIVMYTTTSRTERFRVANDGSITAPATAKWHFYGGTAVAQQTIGANVNNVAASGTTGQFDDFTSGTVYATDYPALHATVYQLTRSVAQMTVALRNYGLGA